MPITDKMSGLTAEHLRYLLSYDPSTGVFIRRVSPRTDRAGRPTGSINPTGGYHLIRLEGRSYMSHRLAWLYMTGEWPEEEIDHINGIRSDNRFENLRAVKARHNHSNRGLSSRNTSGHSGVAWNRANKNWRASFRQDGVRVEVGSFSDLQDAIAAYEDVVKQHRGEYHPTLDTRLRPLYNNTHKRPQAYIELAVPFGAVAVSSEDNLRWCFVGWSPTEVSQDATMVRELQPGETVGRKNPRQFRASATEALLKRFPVLNQYRK